VTTPRDPARTAGPVLVVGTGLLGTSIGLGLRNLHVDVLVADPSPSTLALAVDLGAGRPADTEPDADVRLVVVAAPPDVTADVVAARLAAHPRAVVTDVASVKAPVLQALRASGADLTRYAGGHPMAGRERSGPVAGRADLFAGRPWVVCEGEPAARAAVTDLALDLGAVPVRMDAAAHDEAVALVSHLPQLASSLVAARLREAPEHALALAGQGLHDVTRIAASDPALWVQILAANAAPVAAVLRELRDDLAAVLDALDALAVPQDGQAPTPGARAGIAAAVSAGNDGVARVPGKHGSAPTTYAVVTVVVPDRPGQLGRLFSDVGEIGVNLEDLHLEHSPGQPVGIAELSVLPPAREHLEHSLAARGWTVHG
jgi:prephenate dehydrogenase